MGLTMTLPLDLVAVFLPLLGARLPGLFGRIIGDRASQIVTCACVLMARRGVDCDFSGCGAWPSGPAPHLLHWIQSGAFIVSWAIAYRYADRRDADRREWRVVDGACLFGRLYGHDKGIPRFMAYLSLFTFFMLMLVTSANLLQMFFGWEGVGLLPIS